MGIYRKDRKERRGFEQEETEETEGGKVTELPADGRGWTQIEKSGKQNAEN